VLVLQIFRGALLGGGGLALGNGIALSYGGGHKVVTYAGWYLLAALLLAAGVVFWFEIYHRQHHPSWELPWSHRSPEPPPHSDASHLGEMIQEGRKLAGDEFGGNPSWGEFVAWRERVAGEVKHSLGAVERQRLLEVKPRQGSTPRDHVLAVVEWLKGRRDGSLAQASTSEFARRDDRGELAQRCHMLAGSVERWVEAFKKGHSERAEEYVKEWLEAESGHRPRRGAQEGVHA
jgi:hypothetical protein